MIAQNIDKAKTDGASSQQLAILHQAQQEGKVSVELLRRAHRNVVSCGAKSKIEINYIDYVRPDGWVEMIASAQISKTLDSDQVFQDCESKESYFVDSLYNAQPYAVEATTKYLNQQASALRQCLTKAGIKVKPDATGRELEHLAAYGGKDRDTRQKAFACLLDIGMIPIVQAQK